jgi:hypothetical protein
VIDNVEIVFLTKFKCESILTSVYAGNVVLVSITFTPMRILT